MHCTEWALGNDSCHCNQSQTGRWTVQTVGTKVVSSAAITECTKNKPVAGAPHPSKLAAVTFRGTPLRSSLTQGISHRHQAPANRLIHSLEFDAERTRKERYSEPSKLSAPRLPRCTRHTRSSSPPAPRTPAHRHVRQRGEGGTVCQHGGDCGQHFLRHIPLKSQKVMGPLTRLTGRQGLWEAGQCKPSGLQYFPVTRSGNPSLPGKQHFLRSTG